VVIYLNPTSPLFRGQCLVGVGNPARLLLQWSPEVTFPIVYGRSKYVTCSYDERNINLRMAIHSALDTKCFAY